MKKLNRKGREDGKEESIAKAAKVAKKNQSQRPRRWQRRINRKAREGGKEESIAKPAKAAKIFIDDECPGLF
ncbi:MAG: hypothetical protein IPM66_19580 [Acidobacteriota bacterium]|nr:MAG: hypothetical protein IPM66_19580 [Acidobacteriota bacterium]